MRTHFLVLAGVLAATPALAQSADSVQATLPVAVETPAPAPSLAALVQSDTTLSLFAEGLVKANLMAPLADTSKVFTLLAPSNAVLRATPSYLDLLQRNDALGLFNVLMQHIVPGRYLGAQFPLVPTVKAWTGRDLTTLAEPLSVGGLGVVSADGRAVNGFVHTVDGVFAAPAGS